ncbi:GntR family transcriptional regulator, partial [Adlercreutzia sp. ZJ242]|uniref:GntR family transcriptional regulator n=1 Tax=Adlercreutzia sp. ZJ242 TaxID=2709409 RepID=UPI0013EDC309
MILRIDQTSNEPLYLQIRNQVVAAIARGELLAGDGLPSVRRLASDLGINLHTVNKAYAVLRDEGYLVMRGRSGAYVADEALAASAERRGRAEAALAETLQSLALEYKARGGSAQGFAELAARAAAEAFADPGIAGARRNVGVLGVDAEG